MLGFIGLWHILHKNFSFLIFINVFINERIKKVIKKKTKKGKRHLQALHKKEQVVRAKEKKAIIARPTTRYATKTFEGKRIKDQIDLCFEFFELVLIALWYIGQE